MPTRVPFAQHAQDVVMMPVQLHHGSEYIGSLTVRTCKGSLTLLD